MFAPNDFKPPKPPPIQHNRAIGALVLLLFIMLCLLVTFSVDAAVLQPLNATYAVTQTYQSLHPTAVRPFGTPRYISTRAFDHPVSYPIR